jgi:hypothetical protein
MGRHSVIGDIYKYTEKPKTNRGALQLGNFGGDKNYVVSAEQVSKTAP